MKIGHRAHHTVTVSATLTLLHLYLAAYLFTIAMSLSPAATEANTIENRQIVKTRQQVAS
jgi:hypothetical protein